MFIMDRIKARYRVAAMVRNLDTPLLRAFVAVAETAGMTSAANVLHLTQAAVSQQIKRLERIPFTRAHSRRRRSSCGILLG